MKLTKRIYILLLGAILIVGLCACETYIDQGFIDLNLHAQESSEVATESYTEPPEEPPEESQEETSAPVTSGKKPHGLVLVETSEPPVASDATSEPDTSETSAETSESTKPNKPSGGSTIGGVKISAGLKEALNLIGKTSGAGTYITAFHPAAGADGGITIFRIHNNTTSASQTMYTYYESADDYEAAKKNASSSACYDALRLITQNTTDILPVPNPETMGIVLFDGYILWR